MASWDTMLDPNQRIAWLERALYEGFARIYDSEVITTPSWAQIITPSLDSPLRNAVCLNLSTEAEVDEQIRETIRFYHSRGLPLAWVVGPRTRPQDMGERLLAAGFRRYSTESGLTADLSKLPLAPEPQRMELRIGLELLGEHNIDEWLHVQQVVWSVRPEMLARMREARQRRAFDTSHGIYEYLVRANETAVGSGAVHVLGAFAHLSTGAILPEFRNQGIFQHLVREGLEIIRGMGHSFVTVHAIQSTSAPIFRKMGFHWDCDFTSYVL